MVESSTGKNEDILYLSIDHLEKGTYTLHILEKNEIVKTIEIIKE